MGFFGIREVGLLEKASTIAVKYHIVYNPRKQVFVGDPDTVRKATEQLDLWMNVRARKIRQETRGW
jgi:hypothetical protein